MVEGNEARAMWDVPRPGMRLALVVELGILGAVLFPCKEHFFVGLYGGACAYGAPLWIGAAFAAVAVIDFVEKARVPKRVYAFMAMGVALSAMLPAGIGGDGIKTPAGLGWMCLLGVAILAAGAFASGIRVRREALRSWAEYVLRAPAIAALAPLLLFASRPVAEERPLSTAQRLSRGAITVFPHALAAGFALTMLGLQFRGQFRQLSLGWLSWSVWAWIASALVFLLSPQPDCRRILGRQDRPKPSMAQHALATAVAAMALLVVILLGLGAGASRNAFGIVTEMTSAGLIWLSPAGVILALLTTWPVFPSMPRLADLPEGRKAGAFVTGAFMAVALTPPASFVWRAFLYIVSGKLFTSHFDPARIGGALDQPSLTRDYFLIAMLCALMLPLLAAARWMSDRRSRAGHWVFAVFAIAIVLCPASMLTVTVWDVAKYIGAMGFTMRRVGALLFGLCGYGVLVGFLWWAVRPGGAAGRREGGKVGTREGEPLIRKDAKSIES